MTKRMNWTTVCLIVGALLCVAAVSFAHRRGRGWWQRPDSEPIPNLVFNTRTDGGVQSKDGRVKEIVVQGYRVNSRDVAELENNAVNGAVIDGQVKIRAMTLDGPFVQVKLPVICATLKPNYFNSKFWTDTTATVTTNFDLNRVTREVPVRVHGSIREQNGEYILTAHLRGVLKVKQESEEDSGWGYHGHRGRHGHHHHNATTTITTFKLEMCAAAPAGGVEPPEPLAVAASATDVTCDSDNDDGTATAVASGGSEPYTYLWDDPSQQTTATATALTPGDYSVTVTDADGNIAMASTTVNQPVIMVPTVTITTTDVSCNGGNDGTATATVSGTEQSVAFSWSTGAQTPAITGLSAGTYELTVTVFCGGSAVLQMFEVVISEPEPLKVTAPYTLIYIDEEYMLSVIAFPSGGTPPYSYLWNKGEMTQMVLRREAYVVTVTDANGCTARFVSGLLPVDPNL